MCLSNFSQLGPGPQLGLPGSKVHSVSPAGGTGLVWHFQANQAGGPQNEEAPVVSCPASSDCPSVFAPAACPPHPYSAEMVEAKPAPWGGTGGPRGVDELKGCILWTDPPEPPQASVTQAHKPHDLQGPQHLHI